MAIGSASCVSLRREYRFSGKPNVLDYAQTSRNDFIVLINWYLFNLLILNHALGTQGETLCITNAKCALNLQYIIIRH